MCRVNERLHQLSGHARAKLLAGTGNCGTFYLTGILLVLPYYTGLAKSNAKDKLSVIS